jgi:serine/threonine protein kinase
LALEIAAAAQPGSAFFLVQRISHKLTRMSKLTKQCWEPLGWVRGVQMRAKEGNQSHAFLARRKTDPDDRFGYVLKSLKRQEEPDRRARFSIEVSSMRALDHPGVLNIEATNAEAYKDPVELFLITRLVAGDDLEALVSRGLEFEQAVRIVLGVLDILKHCHSRGVLHRDIKPCHVMVADSNFDGPVLIDFGLAHADEIQPSDAATPVGEGRGNRFLIGPEHLPGVSITNRSSVTDICQCVGLLFFALTRKEPGVLQDENNLKPHRRPDIQVAPTIEPWKQQALQVIFDKGFEWHPDNRWGDIDALSQRLRQLTLQTLSPDELLKLQTARVIQESGVEGRMEMLANAKHMSGQYFDLLKAVANAINGGVQPHLQVQVLPNSMGFGIPTNREVLSDALIRFQRPHRRQGGLDIAVATSLDGSQLVVTLRPFNGSSKIFPDDKPFDLARFKIGDTDSLYQSRADLEQRLLVCVDEVLRD